MYVVFWYSMVCDAVLVASLLSCAMRNRRRCLSFSG